MKKTFVFAFRRSLPILISFFPVGLAYGLLMQNAGYNFLWPAAASRRHTREPKSRQQPK